MLPTKKQLLIVCGQFLGVALFLIVWALFFRDPEMSESSGVAALIGMIAAYGAGLSHGKGK